jgi:hypothetical protein
MYHTPHIIICGEMQVQGDILCVYNFWFAHESNLNGWKSSSCGELMEIILLCFPVLCYIYWCEETLIEDKKKKGVDLLLRLDFQAMT